MWYLILLIMAIFFLGGGVGVGANYFVTNKKEICVHRNRKQFAIVNYSVLEFIEKSIFFYLLLNGLVCLFVFKL